ncbi:MAG TPA: hydrogenase maturation protease [Solirubrobacteraceae bacterium]
MRPVLAPPPAEPRSALTLVVGCGNLLRGDDAVGPVLVRRLLDRGLPAGVEVADAGTSGMDVAFRMRGAARVIVVDAAQTGGEPGTLYRLTGEDVEELPPLAGLNLHSFRWDHALAFGRWALKDEYPEDVAIYLVEAGGLELGAPLTPAVDRAVDALVERLLTQELAR